MKQLMSFFAIMTLSLAVSCSKSKKEKTEDKVDSGNQMISEMNSIQNSLASEGVSLTSSYGFNSNDKIDDSEDIDWLRSIEKQLESYVTKGRAVQNIVNDSDVWFTDNYTLDQNVDGASSVLSTVRNRIREVENLVASRKEQRAEEERQRKQFEKEKRDYFAKNKSFDDLVEEVVENGINVNRESSEYTLSLLAYKTQNGIDKTIELLEGFVKNVEAMNRDYDPLTPTEENRFDLVKTSLLNMKRKEFYDYAKIEEFVQKEVRSVTEKMGETIKKLSSKEELTEEELKTLNDDYKNFDTISIKLIVLCENYIKKHKNNGEAKAFVTLFEKNLKNSRAYRKEIKEIVDSKQPQTEQEIEEGMIPEIQQ